MKIGKRKNRKNSFTLVELVVAMSIFAVLMLILMQIFSATQDVWRKTGSKADSYESARIALNMIAADLAAATYHLPLNASSPQGTTFYYSTKTGAAGGICDQLWFPTRKEYKLDAAAASKEVEACYFLENSYLAGTKQVSNLYLNYTSDNNAGWNFLTTTDAQQTPTLAAMANTKKLLLENVCSLIIRPLTKKLTPIAPGLGNLPYLIQIELSIIDDDEAVKAKYASTDDVKRTFSRFIFIDQGQEL